MILKERDTIAICEYCLFFLDGKLIYNTGKKAGGKALEVEIRSKSVPNQNGFGMIRLLEDIHLEIEQNTLVALLGGSGAGKSTLMDCMDGMEYSGVDGNVWMNGENLYENFERLKYQIGSVPQEPVLHKDYIVEKELRDAALLRLPGDTKKEEINKKVDDVLKWLNLCHVRKSKIKNISGGEKKRVNIGIELVADRSVLYLDEPDAGLDPKSVKELTVLLRDLAHQQGKTIIVIIHNIIEVDRYDQVIFMAKGGKVAFSGSPQAAKKYFKVENLKDAYEKVSNIGL